MTKNLGHILILGLAFLTATIKAESERFPEFQQISRDEPHVVAAEVAILPDGSILPTLKVDALNPAGNEVSGSQSFTTTTELRATMNWSFALTTTSSRVIGFAAGRLFPVPEVAQSRPVEVENRKEANRDVHSPSGDEPGVSPLGNIHTHTANQPVAGGYDAMLKGAKFVCMERRMFQAQTWEIDLAKAFELKAGERLERRVGIYELSGATYGKMRVDYVYRLGGNNKVTQALPAMAAPPSDRNKPAAAGSDAPLPIPAHAGTLPAPLPTGPLSAGGGELVWRNAMVMDHLMVQVEDGISRERLAEALPGGAKVRSQITSRGLYLVEIPVDGEHSVERGILALGGLTGVVKFAEPDFVVGAADTVANDPLFTACETGISRPVMTFYLLDTTIGTDFKPMGFEWGIVPMQSGEPMCDGTRLDEIANASIGLGTFLLLLGFLGWAELDWTYNGSWFVLFQIASLVLAGNEGLNFQSERDSHIHRVTRCTKRYFRERVSVNSRLRKPDAVKNRLRDLRPDFSPFKQTSNFNTSSNYASNLRHINIDFENCASGGVERHKKCQTPYQKQSQTPIREQYSSVTKINFMNHVQMNNDAQNTPAQSVGLRGYSKQKTASKHLVRLWQELQFPEAVSRHSAPQPSVGQFGDVCKEPFYG